jgi:hypothetical protein
MPNKAANVVAGKPLATGGLLRANLGTALPAPANPFNALAGGFASLGYLSDAGVTENSGRSTDKIKAWGGSIVKVVQTEHSYTLEFVLIETGNSEVQKAVNGDTNVATTAATSGAGKIDAVTINSSILPHKAWVVEVADGTARIRIAIPDGQITEVGEVTYTDSDLVGYACTLEAFEDASGNKAYKYISDGQPTTSDLAIITSVVPDTGIAAAGGALLMAYGTNFATVTAVKINAVVIPVADWEYALGGTAIAIKASAQTAGTKPLVMTNPQGDSAPYNLTYV